MRKACLISKDNRDNKMIVNSEPKLNWAIYIRQLLAIYQTNRREAPNATEEDILQQK